MRPHLDIKHGGTITAEGRVRMSFDEDAIAHLMNVLTDLYSDPELAVIREYATNAYDSHRAAGHSDPIEIGMPSAYEPVYKVRDHGTGMSVDTILEQFSKYGYSSKRDTDDEVGMLGLGCKSGLTYTSQFTLISTHEGRTITVLVTREEDGAGAVQVITDLPAEPGTPSGVEVRIPVLNVRTFTEKVYDFFSYWDPGTVLIEGDEPDNVWTAEDSMLIDPDVVIRTDSPDDPDVIVMGMVPYKIPYHDDAHLIVQDRLRGRRLSRVIVRVPIGVVDFTPSREALQFTKRTEGTIADAREFVEHVMFRRAQDEINQQMTYTAAVRKALVLAPVVHQHSTARGFSFRYKGLDVPTAQFIWPKLGEADKFGYREREQGVLGWTVQYDSNAYRTSNIKVSDAVSDKTAHIVGYPGKAVYATAKKKTKQYIRDKGLAIHRVFFYNDEFCSPWLDGVTVIQWSDIEAVVLPPEARVRRKPTDEYRIVRPGGYMDNRKSLPPDVGQIVVIPAGATMHEASVAARLVDGTDDVLCSVLKSKMKGFKKDHPEALDCEEYLAKQVAEFAASLDEYAAYCIDTYSRATNESHYGLLLAPFAKYAVRINDPEVVALATLVASVDRTAIVTRFDNLRTCTHAFGEGKIKMPTPPKFDALLSRFRVIGRRYPLLRFADNHRSRPEEFIQYLNDTYHHHTGPTYTGENY